MEYANIFEGEFSLFSGSYTPIFEYALLSSKMYVLVQKVEGGLSEKNSVGGLVSCVIFGTISFVDTTIALTVTTNYIHHNLWPTRLEFIAANIQYKGHY